MNYLVNVKTKWDIFFSNFCGLLIISQLYQYPGGIPTKGGLISLKVFHNGSKSTQKCAKHYPKHLLFSG